MIEYNDLLEKGFSKKEAKNTVDIMQNAKEKESSKNRFLNTFIYWLLLIVAIIGNTILSIILIPFLMAFKKIPLYFTIFIIAAMFGFLFDQLIRGIENLEKKHHITAWVFIPALAIINTYYMTSFTNHLTETLKLSITHHSPVIISITYVVAFILPYAIRNTIEIFKKIEGG